MAQVETSPAHSIIPQIRPRSDSVSSSSSIEFVGRTSPSAESRARNLIERRRRLGDFTAVRVRNERRNRRPPDEREVIVIPDDDDDIGIGPAPYVAPRQRRHLVSPPPPPLDNHVPPVPNLRPVIVLPHIRNRERYQRPPDHVPRLNPMRRGAVAPDIIPINMPFDFEENHNRGPEPPAIPPAPRRDPSYPPPRPIQVHRNQPQPFPEVPPGPRVALGGGGLFGGRNQHRAVRRHAHRDGELHLPLEFRLFGGYEHQNGWANYFRNALPGVADYLGEMGRYVLGDQGVFYDANDGMREVDGPAAAPTREESPDYQPEWTHAYKPFGFSNTFADETTTVILDNGGTREEKSNRGICARCRSKLVTNGSDEDGNRIYALRCGHMFDARCFHEFAKPAIGERFVDKKGKGKARAQDYYEPLGGEEDEAQVQGSSSAPYQLRSRHNGRAAPSPRSKRATRGGGRRGRKRGPIITSQFYYKCPLKSCLKDHLSVQYDDSSVWLQDKDRGAIAMFV